MHFHLVSDTPVQPCICQEYAEARMGSMSHRWADSVHVVSRGGTDQSPCATLVLPQRSTSSSVHKEANGDADGGGADEGTSGVTVTDTTLEDGAADAAARRKCALSLALARRFTQAYSGFCAHHGGFW